MPFAAWAGRLRARLPRRRAAWDLPALLSAADPKASLAERNLWLVRFCEWLRHAPMRMEAAADADAVAPPSVRAAPGAVAAGAAVKQPLPALRLRHALNVLDRNPEHRLRVAALLARFWQESDTAALLADFGFSPRVDLFGELGERLRGRLLPRSADTTDLGDLFGLLFPRADDAVWLQALDDATLARLGALVDAGWADPAVDPAAGAVQAWRRPFLDAIMYLASAIRAAGFSAPLRRRISAELLADQPFRQLDRAAERVREHAEAGHVDRLLQETQYLRALLVACQRAAASVADHLEDHGVSVDLVFQVDQLVRRTHRLDELLTCMLAPEPAREMARLLALLVRAAGDARSVRALLATHYSLLARKVAERSAERGERYITRDRAAWRAMLLAAAGGGAVLAATTLLKFVLLGLALSAFWRGFAAGCNYAASFVAIQLLHFTVATKQPAMTAPAMAHKLTGLSAGLPDAAADPPPGPVAAGAGDDAVLAGFVDEVAHLIRSQLAGILGNLIAVAPLVLAVQWLWRAVFGAPLVGAADADHALEALTLLGPTPLYAAFTGVLLFASSLIAGWCENWFVWHRLDSALAWNPRIVARLGAARAQRWARWWRGNVSALASNVSLGFMLGLVPPVAAFFGLPLDVRHVTLSTGQLAAALGAHGPGLLGTAAFWWCAAGIAVTAALNLGVSFLLAFKVALRSRGIRTAERGRLYAAIRRRLRREPETFFMPPRG